MAGFCKSFLSRQAGLGVPRCMAVPRTCVSVEAVVAAAVAAEVAELGEVKTRFQGREESCDSSKTVRDICGGGGGQRGGICGKAEFS